MTATSEAVDGVVEAAANTLCPVGDGTFVCDAAALPALHAALTPHHGHASHIEAVEELALFATFVRHEHRSPDAAAALLAVAEGEIPALRATTSQLAHDVAAAVDAARGGKDFTRVTGRSADTQAPRHDPAAPTGPAVRAARGLSKR